MNTTTPTTTPTQIRPGWRAQLLPHKDEALRLRATYKNPVTGKTDWKAAFAAEPDLKPKLLVGPGDEKAQRLRLQQALGDWTNPRKYKYMPKAERPAPSPSPKQYTQFDANSDALRALGQKYTDPQGKIWWKAAFASDPALAHATGMQDTRAWFSALSYWWKTRVRGVPSYKAASNPAPKRARLSQPAGAVVPPAPVPAPAQNGQPPAVLAQRPAARFCSHCGHPIAVEGLAATLVAAMGSAGLSEEQIVETLTQAATTVGRMTARPAKATD